MNQPLQQTRRHFLTSAASGIGGMALAHLLQRDALGEADKTGAARRTDPLVPQPPHFAPRAKACIFVYLAGAPSQFDLFTPKPKLAELAGQKLPESLTKGVRFAFISKDSLVMPSPRKFRQHGQSGMWFSDRLPHLATCADDICMIHSMHTEAFNHHPGQLLMCCGRQQFGLPSVGAWLTYGLGSVSENLPGYVVLTAGEAARGGATLYSSGFLPSTYAGVLFRGKGEPVLNLDSPPGITRPVQRASLDALADLNSRRREKLGDTEIDSRIAAYELAFRMQAAAPELVDMSRESEKTLSAYGIEREKSAGVFARNCLLARRLVERGVRFVNLIHGGWDAHGGLDANVERNARDVDQPLAALLQDLKQRGLLDSTLVVWCTEFGRTPLAQGQDGRDHHPFSFPCWLAGGGTRPGYTHGITDDVGWGVEKGPGAHPRPACHLATPLRPQRQATYPSPPRPRIPPQRRRRRRTGGARAAGVKASLRLRCRGLAPRRFTVAATIATSIVLVVASVGSCQPKNPQDKPVGFDEPAFSVSERPSYRLLVAHCSTGPQ